MEEPEIPVPMPQNVVLSYAQMASLTPWVIPSLAVLGCSFVANGARFPGMGPSVITTINDSGKAVSTGSRTLETSLLATRIFITFLQGLGVPVRLLDASQSASVYTTLYPITLSLVKMKAEGGVKGPTFPGTFFCRTRVVGVPQAVATAVANATFMVFGNGGMVILSLVGSKDVVYGATIAFCRQVLAKCHAETEACSSAAASTAKKVIRGG